LPERSLCAPGGPYARSILTSGGFIMRLNWLKRRGRKKNVRRNLFRPRLERLEDRLAPAIFTVLNTNDGGGGSLRQAIFDAENTANTGGVPDEIHFNIPGSGVHTIHPSTTMPFITDAVIIDGYTQPGASANTLAVGDDAVLKIEIDCSGIDGNLFRFDGVGSTVRGLVINRLNFYAFAIGPSIPSDSNTIAGNFIGTDVSGALYEAGGNNDIFVIGAGNTIGGPTPADRNVIVAGSTGLGRMITEDGNAHGTVVEGNYMGVN